MTPRTPRRDTSGPRTPKKSESDGGIEPPIETVYQLTNPGNGSKVLHADPNCRYLQTDNSRRNLKERPADAFPEWYDRCSVCWPEGDNA